MIRVKCYGGLRRHLPRAAVDGQAELDVPDGTSVNELLRALGIGEVRCVVFVNGAPVADRGTTLCTGAEVVLVVPASGG